MAALLLLVAAALLVVVTVATRRRPPAPLPDLDGYLARWSAAHDGYDATATRLLRGWLTGVYAVARPVAAAGVAPDALTGWTLWLAGVVAVLAGRGGASAVVAGLLLLVAGLGDAFDGAVAVLGDRATAWGYVLDSVADRVAELLFLLAAWAAGAPAWSAVACGAAFGLLEYLRARAGNAGADHTATITVGERPQRVICCALAVGLAGALPQRAADVTRYSLLVLLALSVAGLVQLLVAVRRDLRAAG